MPRLILTFETLHKVLSAERALRAERAHPFQYRPTPTPPGLSHSICGMSIEVLQLERKNEIVRFLEEHDNPPSGAHEVD
ncbi:MAG TPA: DUF3343 domain-containing protein [Planktothrix sp.]|jgi:hypothetical protein